MHLHAVLPRAGLKRAGTFLAGGAQILDIEAGQIRALAAVHHPRHVENAVGEGIVVLRAQAHARPPEEERPAEEDHGHARGQRAKTEAAVRARVDDVHQPREPHEGAEDEQHPTGVKQQFIQRAAPARHDLLQKNIHCAPPNLSILYYSISWAIVDRTWGKNMKFPREEMQFAGKYSIM